MRYLPNISDGLKMLRSESFRAQPLATLYRSILWIACHIWPKRPAIISLKVGDKSFLLDIPPLSKQNGSAGIFILRNSYEPLLQFCNRLINPGNVVIDCGANQGIYSCAFAALVESSGTVVAIEPQPYANALLRNNLKLNGFQQVLVEEIAVSDREGVAVLDQSGGAVSASIVRKFGGKITSSVQTTTLTTIAQKLDLHRIDLIKLDIEGAEYLALVGAKELLFKFGPTLVIEATPQDRNWGRVTNFLTEQGYQPHLFGAHGQLVPVTEVFDDYPNVVYLQKQRGVN